MKNHFWLSIWVRPRETIQKIVTENPNQSLWLLAAIYGFSSLLNLFQTFAVGNVWSTLVILGVAVIFSWLWGYIAFSVWSWFVSLTGKWLKGKGTFTHIRAAYAWSCVPMIFNGLFWLLLIGLFGRGLFSVMPEAMLGSAAIGFLFALLIAKTILWVWSTVIYINTLAQVQQFSFGRSLLNIVIAAVFVLVLFSLLWMVSIKLVGSIGCASFHLVEQVKPLATGGRV